ncbi:MAG: hypothetical protein JWL69_2620 [Phycisphaerales bacterium]|nr:hypothetical protein [Phycisphaerales bacterium]MDB5355275.1 hypothetical protein [Phycisphaerales bacterium]
MALPPSPHTGESPPIRNMRITFWGVQGSCTVSPSRQDVEAYARRIATATLERALRDIAARLENGDCTADSLRALSTPHALNAYHRQLGLPSLPAFDGDTTCIEVQTSEGNTLLFDMGSGLRAFSRHALANWPQDKPRTLHVFASHEHLDHRNGVPLASLFFDRATPFTFHVHGTRRALAALDDRYGLFSRDPSTVSHYDDPIDFRNVSATFIGTEIRTASEASAQLGTQLPWSIRDVSDPIRIGQTIITPFEVYHARTQCLAFHVRHGSATFLYCTDHELRHGDDPADARQVRSMEAEERVLAHCQNADVGYFDGQYFLEEYRGLKGIGSGVPVSRMDWGHGCIEDVIDRSRRCHVRQTYIGHHDPERPWEERFKIDNDLRSISPGIHSRIELAKAGMVIDV